MSSFCQFSKWHLRGCGVVGCFPSRDCETAIDQAHIAQNLRLPLVTTRVSPTSQRSLLLSICPVCHSCRLLWQWSSCFLLVSSALLFAISQIVSDAFFLAVLHRYSACFVVIHNVGRGVQDGARFQCTEAVHEASSDGEVVNLCASRRCF